MHNIIVCDDNGEFMQAMVDLLNKYVNLYNAMVIGFCDGRKALEYCRNNKVDIVYMDIDLGTDNGMSLTKTIKMINPKALLIYVSGYDTYYVDLVNAEPFRFIRKGVGSKFENEVVASLELAMKRINKIDKWSFVFDRQRYVVELERIKYFHSTARKIHIVGEIGEVPECFYGKMDELQQELEDMDSNFARISKSYIVNMNHIMYLGNNRLMIDGKFYSITPKYRQAFKERYFQY